MNDAPSPISFTVNVARLPQRGLEVTIDADDSQREALAAAHGLLEVTHMRADLVVSSWKKGGVKVSGRVQARIAQACIVTLEPVQSRIDEAVSALFLPETSKLAVPKRLADGEILLDAEGEDGPETFSGDTIDVGALVEEFFELGIDPYPRKSGAALEPVSNPSEVSASPLNQKLQELRKKL